MVEKKSLPYLAFGIDSSNHGRIPEVFVAVSTPHPLDCEIKERHPKIHSPARLLTHFGQERDYRFAVVTSEHVHRFTENEILAYTSVGLVAAFQPSADYIDIYIDGGLNHSMLDKIRALTADKLAMARDAIEVHAVPKQRRNVTNLLITLADGQANHLFHVYGRGCRESPSISQRKVIVSYK